MDKIIIMYSINGCAICSNIIKNIKNSMIANKFIIVDIKNCLVDKIVDKNMVLNLPFFTSNTLDKILLDNSSVIKYIKDNQI